MPRMGAVYYNDCLYIAHNSTLLTHRYRHDLGKLHENLLHSAAFVDFIPRFRSAGDQVISSHLEEQRKTLAELVSRIHIRPSGALEDVQEGLEGTGGQGNISAQGDNDEEIRPGSLLKGGLKLAERITTNLAAGALKMKKNQLLEGQILLRLSTIILLFNNKQLS